MTESLINRGPFLAYRLTLAQPVWFVADLSGKRVCQVSPCDDTETAALEIAEALTEYAERKQKLEERA